MTNQSMKQSISKPSLSVRPVLCQNSGYAMLKPVAEGTILLAKIVFSSNVLPSVGFLLTYLLCRKIASNQGMNGTSGSLAYIRCRDGLRGIYSASASCLVLSFARLVDSLPLLPGLPGLPLLWPAVRLCDPGGHETVTSIHSSSCSLRSLAA